MNWYLSVLKKYVCFSGRARRKEFWYFTLINVLITAALAFTDQKLGLFYPQVGIGVLSAIYTLITLLPSTGVLMRRLHDTGRSAWWGLITLIPLLGAVVLLVLLAQNSQTGDNKYGSDPKNESQ
ncbi:MAG: DUF805 domain-containing protein [Vibrionaceae bacterium]